MGVVEVKKFLLSAVSAGSVALGLMSLAAPAQATVLPPVTVACNSSDFTGATILGCEGFYSGNLLNSANTSTDEAALALLGFTWDGSTTVETISGLGGANPTFSPTLSGITYIGVHYGNGGGSPDGTAFFEIDAAPGTTALTLNPPFVATSNLVVYSTGGGGGVPEPATWAMMLVGFGGLGALLRHRRHQNAIAATA